MKLIELNIDKIAALCKKYKVSRLWVFGSILTPRFNDNSDVDFSVEFKYDLIDDLFVIFFDFIEELQTLLGRKVDVVDETAISNRYFRKELDATKVLIYGWKSTKISRLYTFLYQRFCIMTGLSNAKVSV